MKENLETKALIIQSDGSILLDVHAEGWEEARNAIVPFAELEKSPEHMHTFRMTSLSLWNAASAGLDIASILEKLQLHSRYEIPPVVIEWIEGILDRFGICSLKEHSEDHYLLEINRDEIRRLILHKQKIASYIYVKDGELLIPKIYRGRIKTDIYGLGFPVNDMVPLTEGESLAISLREETLDGFPFSIRDYQKEAVNSFLADGSPGTGYGTVVMPCGSGKTIVGIQTIARAAVNTLIISTNVASVHQWRNELLDKTNLSPDDIGEYTGNQKHIRPITIATYNILTWRPDKEHDFPHFALFKAKNWGLIIYDEVHLLPAPVFQVTAEIQSRKRLGLTATLIREDGREGEVFTLIGPKRYDVPWKELESKGWIAEAICHEIRIDLPEDLKISYSTTDKRKQFRIAAENPRKDEIVKQLVQNHREDGILVIGQYLDQLKRIAKLLDAPLISGAMANKQRDVLYEEFRSGKRTLLVVSKVANFAIDLPDASVAIQISGTFGSRQEEAQRLGRILRPKKRNAVFYSLVSRYTSEEEFAENRHVFLAEQGYKYHIEIWDE
jgi:DNA excision repair protein ERCC-3